MDLADPEAAVEVPGGPEGEAMEAWVALEWADPGPRWAAVTWDVAEPTAETGDTDPLLLTDVAAAAV